MEVNGPRLGYTKMLEVRIAELEGQQKPPTYGLKEGKAPGWVKANRPVRPKKERKKRSHGFARRREGPTHRVEHTTASCPDCGIPLIGGRVRGRRQIITIPRVRARVTEHLVFERTCPKCLKRWSPEPDWSALAVGRRRFGISVQSEVTMLREECRLPCRVIQRLLLWRYGLDMSMGQLAALTRGAAERGQEEYAQLREEVRQSQWVKQQQRFQSQLWSICKPYLGRDTPMRVLCQRVDRFLPELFTPGQAVGRTFLVEPRAGADNNAAELSLRPHGGEPEEQRRDPLRLGKRDQGHPGFPVRYLALARD